MITVELNQKNVARAQRILGARIRLLETFRPPFERIARDFYKSQKGWFSNNATWTPLSAGYAKRKQQTHPGRSVLYREGTMYRELTGQVAGTMKVEPRRMRLMVKNATYWIYHQEGRGNNPRRPVLYPGLKHSHIRWARMIREYLDGLVVSIR